MLKMLKETIAQSREHEKHFLDLGEQRLQLHQEEAAARRDSAKHVQVSEAKQLEVQHSQQHLDWQKAVTDGVEW